MKLVLKAAACGCLLVVAVMLAQSRIERLGSALGAGLAVGSLIVGHDSPLLLFAIAFVVNCALYSIVFFIALKFLKRRRLLHS